MKRIFLLLTLLTFKIFSQSVNDYKYVIVPTKFDFLKEEDKYNLNTSTRLLLEKYGFEVFMNNQDMPTDIANNRCKSLTADIINESSLFVTKLKIVLKDCKDNIVFESESGKSREKQFAQAYNLAFRDAAKSFESLNYKYSGENKIGTDLVETKAKVVEETKVVEPYALSSDNPEIFYFAQPIANGFQVVNNEPRVIMRLFNTSQKNVYIGVKGDTNGVVITKNGKWFFEYYEKGNLVSEPINLRF
ncbi:hypothetical protein [Flavobacterium capsici]|uniref:Uncharacterized protein n=1 Tax=Flavobacterium capsici TaxID=3075618 RepID=A0AA96J336_9FLAO|nr:MULTISPECIES: hypothetical protein [unclassified Flavobacterium]WNM20127.1 hypothetical protein RN608_05470 [Flavobacterium sp. PMR2A8]WNM21517.1 hypothetical protein RN605_12640 [Flavobacterium sp. PMTSA4]